MNWKDIVLKNSDIKWRHPRIKIIEDGRVDMILTIPFTEMLEVQSFRAFNYGVRALLEFMEANKDKPLDELGEILEKQIREWQKPRPSAK